MKFLIKSLLFFIFTAIFFGCETKIPINSMTLAKSTISQADKVQANKYNKENFDKAKEHLLNSHTALQDEDEKKAKEEAINSINFANEAIKISLPLLATDSLKNAKDLYSKIDSLNAEKYTPNKFKEIKSSIENSTKLFNNKKHWESHLVSLKASKNSNSIKLVCLSKIPELNKKVATLQKKSSELKKIKDVSIPQENLTLADNLLKESDNNLKQEKIKIAIPLITSAEEKINLFELAVTKAQKELKIKQFLAKLNSLNKEIEDMKKTEKGTSFNKQISEITDLGKVASENISNEKFDEAQITIDKMGISLLAINQKYAENMLIKAEKKYKNITAKDKDKLFIKETSQSKLLLEESKALLANKSFADSSKKSNESLILLSKIVFKEKEIVKIDPVIEKKIEKQETVKKPIDKIYIVKRRKKNTDCLWRIALKQYDDARLWPLIYVANKKMIKNPDLIFPGQRFIIPPKPKKVTKASKSKNKLKKKK